MNKKKTTEEEEKEFHEQFVRIMNDIENEKFDINTDKKELNEVYENLTKLDKSLVWRKMAELNGYSEEHPDCVKMRNKYVKHYLQFFKKECFSQPSEVFIEKVKEYTVELYSKHKGDVSREAKEYAFELEEEYEVEYFTKDIDNIIFSEIKRLKNSHVKEEQFIVTENENEEINKNKSSKNSSDTYKNDLFSGSLYSNEFMESNTYNPIEVSRVDSVALPIISESETNAIIINQSLNSENCAQTLEDLFDSLSKNGTSTQNIHAQKELIPEQELFKSSLEEEKINCVEIGQNQSHTEEEFIFKESSIPENLFGDELIGEEDKKFKIENPQLLTGLVPEQNIFTKKTFDFNKQTSLLNEEPIVPAIAEESAEFKLVESQNNSLESNMMNNMLYEGTSFNIFNTDYASFK